MNKREFDNEFYGGFTPLKIRHDKLALDALYDALTHILQCDDVPLRFDKKAIREHIEWAISLTKYAIRSEGE